MNEAGYYLTFLEFKYLPALFFGLVFSSFRGDVGLLSFALLLSCLVQQLFKQ